MNAHAAIMLHGLQSQVAGPHYVEHHFGWWSLGCLVGMFVLMKCGSLVNSLIRPSSGKGIKKFSQQAAIASASMVVGILQWAATFAGAAFIILLVMWAIAMRHHPGLM